MIVKIYEFINGDDTLRNRDTAKKIIEIISKEPNESIILDFDKIEFATRSFLNELLSNISERKVSYININKNIKEMMKVSYKGAFTTA